MHSTDLRPINVTILHEGAFLSVALSDSRSVGRFGRVELAQGLLEELQARAAGKAGSAAPEDAATRCREVGSAIFSRLLPEGIRAFLLQCPPRHLNWQISASLVAVPWELAFDGVAHLGEKFQMARQIVSEEEIPAPMAARPHREFLQVLLVSEEGRCALLDAHVQDLRKQLGAIPNLQLKSVRAAELSRSDALRLAGESNVVHFVGNVHGKAGGAGEVEWWKGDASISPRDLAGLPSPPQLLVSEDTASAHTDAAAATGNDTFAAAACRAGLSIVVLDCSLQGGESRDFIQALYRQLARGTGLGEAARQARALARGNASHRDRPCRDAALYGDATLALTSDRAPQPDDLRQVTIMSHDLVDSTRLLATLGAERYSDLLASYHERCASIVAGYGGVSDDPQGDDGIMCYFGVPIAHEDAAARALRAGLEILEAIAELGVKVRIGVVTGQVVVKAGQPVGVAIHLAARLQSIAQPGTLVVGESTRRIIREQFRFARVEHIPDLKGFDRPTEVYRLLAQAQDMGTEHFDTAPKLTPFIGRERELRLIEAHWAAARAGAARAVLVSGEAGIGKSRLLREFRHTASLTRREAIESRCAPDHANSAFHPVIEFVRRLLELRESDSAQSRFDKVDAALATGIDIDGAAQLIAALLSIPFESRSAQPEYSPEKRRQLTLEVLVRWICREAGKAPLCLIVEDVQWMDPSSGEFLGLLVAKAARLPLLVLLTERSDAAQTPGSAIAAYQIELGGLSRNAARAMILGACAQHSIADEVIDLLADRADGVPLYIEESTRMAVELRAGSEPASALQLAVPATLQDLLMARLDRLGNAKQVAQLGAAIGREFTPALLRALVAHESSPIRMDDLDARLKRLTDSGLLIRRGEPPNAYFHFKHALVRDAAYQSLWERDRKSLHRCIAIVAAESFPEVAESQPELLAHHYAEAGMDAEALAHWERAARRAASRSAHAEAIGHLNRGLQLIARLDASPERDRVELGLQLLLAGQLIATEGYGAEQVGRVYARALELCQAMGDTGALAKIRLGLEGYHFMRADFEQAHANAVQAAAMLADATDPMRRLQSAWAIANILFHQGELATAVARMDDCIKEYDRALHHPRAVQDPGVMCLCYSAWGKWELGHADQAIERAREVVALAESLKHRFSMGEAYGFCTSVHHFRGENAAALECAQRAIEICEDGGFAVWLAHAKLMRGRVLAEEGDAEAGIAEMSLAYDMWAATGAVVTTPFYLAMQAEGLALAGRPDDGLVLLQRAFDIVCKYGERYYEAEIRRLFGELILQAAAARGRDDSASAEAERWFQGALALAREKQLYALVLRSAASLARLRLAQGRRAEALQILEPAYGWFQEGMDTRDLLRARALLDSLRLKSAAG